MHRTMRSLVIAVALGAGCGSPALKQIGEECVASAECDQGLVCDLGAVPHVCAATTTIDAREIDAPFDAPEIDGGPPDAAMIDGRVPDAAMIDAATIDAPAIDAALPIDAAPPVDASVDAEIDAL